jgi:hypothetical protein
LGRPYEVSSVMDSEPCGLTSIQSISYMLCTGRQPLPLHPPLVYYSIPSVTIEDILQYTAYMKSKKRAGIRILLARQDPDPGTNLDKKNPKLNLERALQTTCSNTHPGETDTLR